MTFDVSSIEPTAVQRDLSAYIKAETGKLVKPETIAVIDALRKEFRATENERREAARKEKAAKKAQEAVETLRKQAEILGLDLSALLGGTAVPLSPAEVESEAQPDEDNEPEPEPAPKRKPRPARKTKERPLKAVPSPADDEPLVPEIDVVESADGWQQSPTADDGFEEEDGEDW